MAQFFCLTPRLCVALCLAVASCLIPLPCSPGLPVASGASLGDAIKLVRDREEGDGGLLPKRTREEEEADEDLTLEERYEKAAKELAEMLREQEKDPNAPTIEDVVSAGLEDATTAAHFDGVLDLDDVTFDKILAAAASVRWKLLLFMHAPWDEECKKLAPFVRALGRKFSSSNSVLLAKADVDRFSQLATRFDVTTYTWHRTYKYPHFILFEPGDTAGKHYSGKFTAEGITDFVLDVAKAGLVDSLHTGVSEFMAEGSRTQRRRIVASTEEATSLLSQEEQEDAKYYIKVMDAVVEKGNGFISKEISRISNIIESGNAAADKSLELKKRLNVLRVFATFLHDEL